MPKKWNFL
jgi:hypothetical protein